jgi:hypothetical protein
MSSVEIAPLFKPAESTELLISKVHSPLGETAITGFNGSGESHSLFSDGEFSSHAKVNGFKRPLERTHRTEHLISVDRSGNLQVRKHNYAEILDLLSAHFEHEVALKKLGKEPILNKFALIVDSGEDYKLIDGVNFIGFEFDKEEKDNKTYPKNAIFSEEPPQDNGQLTINGNVSIPLKDIHHIKYAMPAQE